MLSRACRRVRLHGNHGVVRGCACHHAPNCARAEHPTRESHVLALSALVAGIRGDYLNVVGLPVAALLELVPDLLE